jgi:hypothetical protein
MSKHDHELQFLRKQMLDSRQNMALRTIVTPMRPVLIVPLLCQIIGGQTVNGVVMIQYAADPLTAPTAYNPNTATSYIAGLGYGQIYNNLGQQAGKVVVRHNWLGQTDPFLSGDTVVVGAPVPIPVTGGGTLLVYPIIRG